MDGGLRGDDTSGTAFTAFLGELNRGVTSRPMATRQQAASPASATGGCRRSVSCEVFWTRSTRRARSPLYDYSGIHQLGEAAGTWDGLLVVVYLLRQRRGWVGRGLRRRRRALRQRQGRQQISLRAVRGARSSSIASEVVTSDAAAWRRAGSRAWRSTWVGTATPSAKYVRKTAQVLKAPVIPPPRRAAADRRSNEDGLPPPR